MFWPEVKEQTQSVLNTLDKAQTRSNVMHRALRQVEALPEGQVPGLVAQVRPKPSDGEVQ
jgi:DNA recombination protein RmuC